MTHILVLGANGQLAKNTTQMLLAQPDVHLTLYLRRASRLKNPNPARVRIIEGDVLNGGALEAAMHGQDVVYANLSGAMKQQSACIVQAMRAAGIRRLIFIRSMGIYGEVPGENYERVLDPYRESAALVEASGLDYTILRPEWFTHDAAIHYHLTHNGLPFEGREASLDCAASRPSRTCRTCER